MVTKRGDLILPAVVLILAILSAGCSYGSQTVAAETTVPANTVTAKFTAGDIIAKAATSTDTFLLIVKYDAVTDRYERALAYKKPDGTWYRKDDRTEVTGRSVIERIYPAKVAHVVSLNEVPVGTPTAATTVPTVTATTTTTTSYPAPTVSSILPNTGLAGTVVTIRSISGTDFRPGASVRLTNATSSSTIFGTSVTVRSASNITCLFSIPSVAIAGLWNVTVTNIDGKSGTLGNAFTITNTTTTAIPAPTVSGITPNAGIQGAIVSITSLTGTGFQSGATVNLSRSGSPNITATNVMVSPTLITCSISLPSDAATGSWNVVVTNPDHQLGTLTGGFTIIYPAPTITDITPNNNGTLISIPITNLAGTGFRSGATVKLTKSDQPDIIASDVVVVSSSQITCTFNVDGALVGTWNVVVTNTDTQTATYSGFTIMGP